MHLILNPQSGGGRGRRMREPVLQQLAALGVQPVVQETQAAGQALELARSAAQEGATIVVAAGGDGTIHDVANGLLAANTRAALGVIPLGTGNDFAKLLHGADSVGAACAAIAQARIRFFDVGRVEWASGQEYFVNGMGTGIDVQVVRQMLRLPHLPGPLRYLLALMRALATYRPLRLRAQVGVERIEQEMMLLTVSNGICQGGGFFLTPAARPDDGVLDFCAIAGLSLLQIPLVLSRVLRGTHGRHAAVTMGSVQQIRIESGDDVPLVLQLDGELRNTPTTWADVSVQPGALRVVDSTDVGA